MEHMSTVFFKGGWMNQNNFYYDFTQCPEDTIPSAWFRIVITVFLKTCQANIWQILSFVTEIGCWAVHYRFIGALKTGL